MPVSTVHLIVETQAQAQAVILVLWFYSQGLVSTHANEPNSPTTDQQISTASTFMSLGANVVGTVCIAAKALYINPCICDPP